MRTNQLNKEIETGMKQAKVPSYMINNIKTAMDMGLLPVNPSRMAILSVIRKGIILVQGEEVNIINPLCELLN